MSLGKRLYLDEIVTSFPELGPTVPDGGYSWIILFSVLLVQMTVPSILSMYGVVLGYLTEHREDRLDLWNEKIILTPMLFMAFWSLADPWSTLIVELASIPRLVGLIGVCLISIGVLASGYLATGGVGAYLTSLSAGAVMGIGASFVLVQSEECLRKYFRVKLSLALTMRNAAYSIGQVLVPSLTHFLLARVSLKMALFLVTIIFVPTVLGVVLLRQPLPRQSPTYSLFMTNEEDNELPVRTDPSSEENLQIWSKNATQRPPEREDFLFASNNEIYSYENAEDDIFARPIVRTRNNKWKDELQILGYKEFWAVAVAWIGLKSFVLFFWILLPSIFIVKMPNVQSFDYSMVSVVAASGAFVSSLGTFWILNTTIQRRKLLFGCFSWLGCVVLVGLLEVSEYFVFIICAFLGGLSIAGLSISQDSAICDVVGLQFAHRSRNALSLVVGLSLILFCFLRSVPLCFHFVIFFQFIGGCYWIWSPFCDLMKSCFIRHSNAT